MTEMMVVVALLAVLAVPILSTLRSATRAEADLGARLDDEADRRSLQLRFTDDVHGAPLALTGVASDGATNLVVAGVDGADDVRWRLRSGRLERLVLDPTTGGVTSTATIVEGDLDPLRSRFVYHSGRGTELDAADVRLLDRCAVIATIELWTTDADDAEFDLGAALDRPVPEEGDDPCP